MSPRRSFLKLAGGSCVWALLAQCRRRDSKKLGATEKTIEFIDAQWSGIGFGIKMHTEWYRVNRLLVEQLDSVVEETILQLEEAFSLYSDSSELSRLNRERVLLQPSALFVELLNLASSLSERTFGFYQPAIHGAWKRLTSRDQSLPFDWEECVEASSLDYLTQGNGRLELTHPLTEVSFNALVQGFLADKVAQQARAIDVTTALLHLGETYAIGQHPAQRDWSLAVTGTPIGDAEAELLGVVDFSNAGLAVSTNDSTRLLVNPRTGKLQQHDRVVAVTSSEGAATADAFATAFSVATHTEWQRLYDSLIKRQNGGVKVWQRNQLVFEKSSGG